MTLNDLETFKQAIALAELGKKAEAHTLLMDLRRTNPDNCRILLCLTFTADDLNEAHKALEAAARLEPGNSSVAAAKIWLAHQQKQNGSNFYRRVHQTATVHPVPTRLYYEPQATTTTVLDRPKTTPTEAPARLVAESVSHSLANKPLYAPLDRPRIEPRPTQPLEKSAVARPVSQPAFVTQKLLIYYPKMLAFAWWKIWVGLLVIATIVAGLTLPGKLNPFSNLTEAEKSYWSEVRKVNEQTNTANAQLQNMEKQGLNRLALKQSIRHELEVFEEVNTRFRSIQSPSTRFDRVDSLLGLAFSYYSEGANLISQGLEDNDQNLIKQGNNLLVIGNDFLNQARTELKNLGLMK